MVDNKNNNKGEFDYREFATAISSAVAGALSDRSAESANEAVLKINDKVRERQIKQQAYASRIIEEMKDPKNCVEISIPEIYKRYCPSITATINGCSIHIKANGKKYKVHKDFARIIQRRLDFLSKKVNSMSTPDVAEYSER